MSEIEERGQSALERLRHHPQPERGSWKYGKDTKKSIRNDTKSWKWGEHEMQKRGKPAGITEGNQEKAKERKGNLTAYSPQE